MQSTPQSHRYSYEILLLHKLLSMMECNAINIDILTNTIHNNYY